MVERTWVSEQQSRRLCPCPCAALRDPLDALEADISWLVFKGLTFLAVVVDGPGVGALSSSIKGVGSGGGAVGGGTDGARETDREPAALLGSRPLGAEGSGCTGGELGGGACCGADVDSDAVG